MVQERIISTEIDLKHQMPESDVNKYITEITDTGISIHPKEWTTDSHYLQLSGEGTFIKESTGIELSKFTGNNIQIGQDNEWKVNVNKDGIYILDPNNRPINQMTAKGNVIGYEDETHAEIDYHSLQLIAMGETTPYFWVSDLRDKDDNYQATMTETFTADGATNTFIVQINVSAEVSATDSSHSSNTVTRDGQRYTFATTPSNGAIITIVYKTKSNFAKAYTFGHRRSGTIGAMSVAEGTRTEASGYSSHAEGYVTTARGSSSHAEGTFTEASGYSSHAEGSDTTASGGASHSEGSRTEASGYSSHAQNEATRAGYRSQTAIGKYNNNQQDNIFEIGNGTDDNNRSNALAVDWNGNIRCAGGIYATPTEISLTFSQCTNGSYTRCYKVGNMVFFSWNINITTATANYDYIRGLPVPLGGGWGCSATPTGSVNTTRWWVTPNGTLRTDGATVTGWQNGSVSYICQ